MTTPLPPPLRPNKTADAFTDLLDGAFLLRQLLAQRLHRDHPAGHLVIPQHQRELRAALVGALELRLEAAAAQIDLQGQIAATRRAIAPPV